MSVRKLLKLQTTVLLGAMLVSASPFILTACGGGGGGTTTTAAGGAQQQNNTVVIEGSLPEGVTLDNQTADIRAVGGVKDVVAICDSGNKDGYFTDNGT